MYVPQFYPARGGGHTAGLSIDGFDLQRATFCWNIHCGTLELLHINSLQTVQNDRHQVMYDLTFSSCLFQIKKVHCTNFDTVNTFR